MTGNRQGEMANGRFLPPALLMCGTAVFLLLLCIKSPATSEPVAVVFPLGTTSEQAFMSVAALNGRVIRGGGSENVIIAAFDKGTELQSLRKVGVLVTLNPIAVGGCSAQISIRT